MLLWEELYCDPVKADSEYMLLALLLEFRRPEPATGLNDMLWNPWVKLPAGEGASL